MNNEEKKLKIYEIWQQIIIHATKEFYLLDTALLAVFSAIFYYSYENSDLRWIGFIGAIIWILADITQLMWKRNWTGRIQKLEDTIINKDEPFTEDKQWNPKFFYIPLHLNFILSFLPILFIFLFGIELKLFGLEWILSLASQLCEYKEIIFLIFIVILIIKLFHASFCYFPYSSPKKKK